MSESSSARIQITKGISLSSKYGVDDRSMPAILMITGSSSSSSSRMDVNEWNNICDQVDDIVLPLNNIRKNLLGSCLLVPISFAIFIAVVISLSFIPGLDGDIDSRIIPIVFIIMPSAFIGLVITVLYSIHKVRKAFLEVNQVCIINSQKYANKLISFDLHDDKTIVRGHKSNNTYHDRYILVSIISNHPNVDDANDVEFGATTGAGALSLPPAVDAFAATTTNNNSIEGRLRMLEQNKHMISATEYNEKKKVIISEI
jgi:hypothetical protein